MPSNDLRSALVVLARAWVGTPLRAGPPAVGAAVDDWAMVRAVGEACKVLTVDTEVVATLIEGARRALAEAVLKPVELGQIGDIALVDGRLAILGDFNGRASLIRVDGHPTARVYATKAPAARVVEHGFAGHWPGRVEAWFRYPGLDRG